MAPSTAWAVHRSGAAGHARQCPADQKGRPGRRSNAILRRRGERPRSGPGRSARSWPHQAASPGRRSLPARAASAREGDFRTHVHEFLRRAATFVLFGCQVMALSLCGVQTAAASSASSPTATVAQAPDRWEKGRRALGSCAETVGSHLKGLKDLGERTSAATLSKAKRITSWRRGPRPDAGPSKAVPKKRGKHKKVDMVLYSTFYHAVRGGKVKSVKFDDNSPKIYFEVAASGSSGETATEWFSTKRVPSDASLLPLLIQKNVDFGTRSSVSSSLAKVAATALLLWLPLLPLFLFVRRQIQQQQGMGKSNSKRRNLGGRRTQGPGSDQNVPEVTFKDVAGADYAIEELKEIVDFLRWKQMQVTDLKRKEAARGRSKYATAFLGNLNVFKAVRSIGGRAGKARGGGAASPDLKSHNAAISEAGKGSALRSFIKMPRGVLLSGPPGTGKTLLAKAVAGEASVPFFACSASEFVELFVGRGAARVRDLFKQARMSAPSIVFIDEIDAVGGKRGAGLNEERDQTLNQLLTELDGFNEGNSADGLGPDVLLMCATNRPEVLDDALIRPGRLSRKVKISLPDKKGRRDIALVYLKDMPLHELARGEKEQTKLELQYADLVAEGTAGFSGADLSNVVNEAVLMATRRGGGKVDAEDIVQGILRTKKPITGNQGLMDSIGLPLPWMAGKQNVMRGGMRIP